MTIQKNGFNEKGLSGHFVWIGEYFDFLTPSLLVEYMYILEVFKGMLSIFYILSGCRLSIIFFDALHK